ncbi:MAG: TlpA family protein disulfide reductase [Spirochaetes bacterium]|nr:TlpA family protein disulfide reductase [Spirochaetota bacterium]
MKKTIAALTIIFTFSVTAISEKINAKAPVKKAPGIALEDTNGKFVMLSSLLSASNLVISFWSYDCPPCRKEMPELQQMAGSGLFKQKNVKIIFVYVEAKTEKTIEAVSERPPREKALEILQMLDIRETCLLDIYGMAYNNYRKAANIKKAAMPLLFLVNKNKDILFSAIGYNEDNLKKLEKAIDSNF